MGLYANWILPRLIDLCMRNREVERYRALIVPQARGRVLEIGIGSGLNLPFYGEAVQQLYGLDPSAPLLTMSRERADGAGCPVDLIECGAEAIPLEDGSIDTVVMTFTLCSVADPLLVLREIRRVLQPQGVLLFAEHGLAPEAQVRRWQHRLTPGWRHIAGGCHLNRKVDALIGEACFAIDELVTGYARGPRPMTYIYCGRASIRSGRRTASPATVSPRTALAAQPAARGPGSAAVRLLVPLGAVGALIAGGSGLGAVQSTVPACVAGPATEALGGGAAEAPRSSLDHPPRDR